MDIPKYRKSLLLGPIEKRLEELFYEIAEEHGFEILEMLLMPDQMHLVVSAARGEGRGAMLGRDVLVIFGEGVNN